MMARELAKYPPVASCREIEVIHDGQGVSIISTCREIEVIHDGQGVSIISTCRETCDPKSTLLEIRQKRRFLMATE